MKGKMLMLVLLSVLLLAGCSSSESTSNESSAESSTKGKGDPGKVYELNLNVSAGPVHPFTKQVAEPWAEMVEKETKGVVQVNVHPSAALGQLSTAYEDIKSGLYEAGLVSPGRHVDTDLFPLTIGDLPFLIESPAVAENVLTKFANKYMKNTFEEGTFMSVSSTDAFQLYSKKPIRTSEDIKNVKIADNGSVERIELLKGLGSAPVSLNNTELYESIEKGVVDGVNYTAVGANAYKLDEVAPYMTKLNIGTGTLLFMMNTDFLDDLPEDVRNMFLEKFGPAYGSMITKLYSQSSNDAIASFTEMVKAKGGEVIIPSEEELKAFKAPAKQMMEAWMQKANEKGYPGQEMMDYFTGLLKEQGVILPE
ncbi:TRAP transporter substrate-binding protein DctP [Ammoniphilus sp. 3BR4]|uniref:TRAP transporter substrate-binding protein DctP n=1 Tax=Ammoniphilus sp. 3BR4 TaxID=3158265 RepID=UPI003464F2D2